MTSIVMWIVGFYMVDRCRFKDVGKLFASYTKNHTKPWHFTQDLWELKIQRISILNKYFLYAHLLLSKCSCAVLIHTFI